jgi:hypothetical protein
MLAAGGIRMRIKKPSANDWQDFSLKKDIEALNRQVKNVCNIGSTVIIEVLLAFGAVFVDRYLDIFPVDTREIIVISTAIVMAVIPIVLYGIPSILRFFRNISVSVNFKTEAEYIDVFDNEVCYNVMIADSFLDLLKSDTGSDGKRKVFYFTETRFYLNRAIDRLLEMSVRLKRIFDDDIDSVIKNKKVSVARLINILDIIVSIENDVKEPIQELSISDSEIERLSNTAPYTKKLTDFLLRAHTDLNLDIRRYRN